jgi:hypothetical protein
MLLHTLEATKVTKMDKMEAQKVWEQYLIETPRQFANYMGIRTIASVNGAVQDFVSEAYWFTSQEMTEAEAETLTHAMTLMLYITVGAY